MGNEYEFKFFLNAKHYIHINKSPGEIHPHSWEIKIKICPSSLDFFTFTSIEKEVEKYITSFSGVLLNDIPEFVGTDPTMEVIAAAFSKKIGKILSSQGWTLYELAVSENPTRTYIVKQIQQGQQGPNKEKSKDRIYPEGLAENRKRLESDKSWAELEKEKWRMIRQKESQKRKSKKKLVFAILAIVTGNVIMITLLKDIIFEKIVI